MTSSWFYLTLLHFIYGQFKNSAISFDNVTTAPAALFSSTGEYIYIYKYLSIQCSIRRRRCENNIKTDLKEIGWESVDWLHVA